MAEQWTEVRRFIGKPDQEFNCCIGLNEQSAYLRATIPVTTQPSVVWNQFLLTRYRRPG